VPAVRASGHKVLKAADYRPKRPSTPGKVTLAFVGDVMFSRHVETLLDKKGYAWAFAAIKPVFDQADLVVANLESPVGEGGVPYAEKQVYLKGRPEALDALSLAGIEMVSLANNHILDYGPELAAQTRQELDARGIAYHGLVEEGGDSKPVILERQGVKMAFLSFCSVCPAEFEARGKAPGVGVALPSVMNPQVRKAKEKADYVVVLIHWGQEYGGSNPLQAKLASGLEKAGADLVIGSHAHVVQEVALQGRTLVAYNIGNFLFDLNYEVSQDSMVLLVDLAPGKPPVFRVIPVGLQNHRPEPVDVESKQGKRILKIAEEGYDYNGKKKYEE
jgi:poly-gamma-glutamate synthesis protein (capsule biosynthesis protein)